MNVRDEWLLQGGDRPSLGTAYLASYARAHGAAEVLLWDMHHARVSDLFEWLVTKPFLVGISFTTPQYREAVRLARAIKQRYPEQRVIAGGAHPTAIGGDVPADCFDYVMLGESERSFARLCQDGVYPTERVLGGEGVPDKCLDAIPHPARSLLPMSDYTLTLCDRRCTPMMTSRGCPWHCSFCSEPLLNNRFRAHSPEYVLGEMAAIRAAGAEAVIIYDDVYIINARRVMDICRRQIDARLDLIYRATTRSDDVLRYPDLLPLLRDSGCVELCLGVESGSDAVLRRNDKGMTVDKNRRAIARIKEAGIRVLTYLIVGLPGCSEETERASLSFLAESDPDECGIYLLAPFPGTPLWVDRARFGATIFEDEIRANDWDVAQVQADVAALRCYVDYSAHGGLGREDIKALWLEIRAAWEIHQARRRRTGIQARDVAPTDAVGWAVGK